MVTTWKSSNGLLLIFIVSLCSLAPSGPPQGIAVRTITSNSLQFSWEPLSPEEQNGLVQSYNIVVFEIDTNTTKSIYQDFQHHSIFLSNLHPYYHYELSVAAFTVALGPYASTVIQTKQDGKPNYDGYAYIMLTCC